ncbi:SpoIIE family protein phosphatase [Streptomyces aureus]|uniref:SpoIIE family protein phosphatase n=1 Tax=Streptomyces aureus TaxID=193461 RepID=A0ABV4SQL5_9ACTN
MLDQIRIATWLVGSDGRTIVAWGAQASELLGYGPEEVLGRDTTRVMCTKPDQARAEAVLDRVLAGERFADVFPMLRRDGQLIPVEFRTEPLVDRDGRTSILTVATDAQAVRGVEGGLTLLEAFFTQSPVSLAVYDAELRCVRVNGAFTAMTGLSPRQLLGQQITQSMFDPAAAEVERIVRRVIRTGAPAVDVPVMGRTRADPDHDHVWSFSLFPLQDGQGRIVGTSSSVIDITAQYRARQRLTLLYEAGVRIGTTLEVVRTAEELAEVATPRFADFATVDLAEAVPRGEEPTGPSPQMHRVAVRGGRADGPLYPVGEALRFVDGTTQASAMESGRGKLLADLTAGRDWRAHDPDRAAEILDSGIHSLISVPLRARGVVLGMADFWRAEGSEPFEEDDLSLAEELAARAAVAIDNARRYTREHTMAVTLQRSLLPHTLPEQTAVEVAHRYNPAQAGVGGDWFDVIPLPGTRVALVVGDVVGHGLHAAATMGRLRTAVHNFSALDLSPGELLAHLDELVAHIDTDLAADESAGITGATCLYAIYDPVSGVCTIARAGHLGPALVHSDGTVTFPDVPVSPPLGLGGSLPFETAVLQLPEGSQLVLYTDGLVENRHRDLDTGLEILRGALSHPDRPPEQTCQAVFDALLPQHPSDDIALLVARTRILDPDRVAAWDVPSDPAAVSHVRADVTRRLETWDLEHVAFTTELIISELVTNAIRYGTQPIRLRLLHDRNHLICEVADGSNTSPHLRRATTTDEGGRGLFLVAQCAERWGTRYTARGKVIWAEQRLNDGATGPSVGLADALLDQWDE